MSIRDHEWGDKSLETDISPLHTDENEITVDIELIEFFTIYKKDAIAIAKHFKLTESDLKEGESWNTY